MGQDQSRHQTSYELPFPGLSLLPREPAAVDRRDPQVHGARRYRVQPNFLHSERKPLLHHQSGTSEYAYQRRALRQIQGDGACELRNPDPRPAASALRARWLHQLASARFRLEKERAAADRAPRENILLGDANNRSDTSQCLDLLQP